MASKNVKLCDVYGVPGARTVKITVTYLNDQGEPEGTHDGEVTKDFSKRALDRLDNYLKLAIEPTETGKAKLEDAGT